MKKTRPKLLKRPARSNKPPLRTAKKIPEREGDAVVDLSALTATRPYASIPARQQFFRFFLGTISCKSAGTLLREKRALFFQLDD